MSRDYDRNGAGGDADRYTDAQFAQSRPEWDPDDDTRTYGTNLREDMTASIKHAAKEATLDALIDSGMSFDEAFKRVFGPLTR